MKKLVSLVVAAATFAFASFGLQAAVVGEETAEAAASGFLARSSAAKRILPDRSVESVEQCGNLWIAHLSPSGYIELAGSTKCAPVISFSSEDFAEPDPASPLVAKLRADSEWCEAKEYDESVEESAEWAKLTTPATRTRRLLAASAPSAETSDPFVGPLLNASWYQDAPYNDLSPLSSLSGCMATAAGMEHRYWRWPYR